MKKAVLVILLVTGITHQMNAATLPGSISRDPLVRGNVSDRLSIGVGYDRIKHDVKLSGSGEIAVLRADSLSGYLGYNGLPWLTTFVTAGGTKWQGEAGSSDDYAMRVSVGVNAYLYEADVLTPAFAAGRISIKGVAELARHEADTRSGTTEWFALTAALPVGYEFFDRYPANKSGLSTSLALYAGPAVSFLDGDLAIAPGFKQGFKQDQYLGFVAGVDVYFAPTVSLGLKALVMDQVTTGASLRFHF